MSDDTWMHRESAPERVWLFGASNLWFSRGAAIHALSATHRGCLQVGLACGPGRSYGLTAGNGLVRYRALKEVLLALDTPDSVPHHSVRAGLAVLTDIGNDIAYGVSPERLMGWVRDLAGALCDQGHRVVLTGLPLKSLRRVPDWLFQTLSLVYFGKRFRCRRSLEEALEDTEERLLALCAQGRYAYLSADSSWYGWDGFHLRSSCRDTCWQVWTERLGLSPYRTTPRPGWLEVAQIRPDHYWLWGRPRRSPGTGIRLYPDIEIFGR